MQVAGKSSPPAGIHYWALIRPGTVPGFEIYEFVDVSADEQLFFFRSRQLAARVFSFTIEELRRGVATATFKPFLIPVEKLRQTEEILADLLV